MQISLAILKREEAVGVQAEEVGVHHQVHRDHRAHPGAHQALLDRRQVAVAPPAVREIQEGELQYSGVLDWAYR